MPSLSGMMSWFPIHFLLARAPGLINPAMVAWLDEMLSIRVPPFASRTWEVCRFSPSPNVPTPLVFVVNEHVAIPWKYWAAMLPGYTTGSMVPALMAYGQISCSNGENQFLRSVYFSSCILQLTGPAGLAASCCGNAPQSP